MFADAGLARLRRKSVGLTGRLLELLEVELGARARVLTPADPERRGAQVALQFDPPPRRATEFAARLRAAGVVADWRPPTCCGSRRCRSTTDSKTWTPRCAR